MFAFWVCVGVKSALPHLPFCRMYPTEDFVVLWPKSHHLERTCKRWQKRYRIPQEHFEQSERLSWCVYFGALETFKLGNNSCLVVSIGVYVVTFRLFCWLVKQCIAVLSDWLIGRNVYRQVGIGPGSVCTTRKQTGLEGRMDPCFFGQTLMWTRWWDPQDWYSLSRFR